MPSELDIFQSLPRRARRKVSRDQARKHPIAPLPPRGHDVADRVNTPRPMPHRIVTPRSGQLRINTKRNHRAAYWRTVKMRVSIQAEPHIAHMLQHLGAGARLQGRTVLQDCFAVDYDVHLTGIPDSAVRMEPVYKAVFSGEHYEPYLDYVIWYDADGNVINAETIPA